MPPPAPTAALLLHAQPDGGWHVDWLLQARPPAGADDRVAVGWRVAFSPSQLRPDQMQPGQTVEAEPLPPHRALYLNLQQPTILTGDRGTVTPLAWGWLEGAAPASEAAGAHAQPLAPPPTFTIRWHHGATLTYRTHAAAGAASAASAASTTAAAPSARIECIARSA